MATATPAGLRSRRHRVVLARLGRRVAAHGRLGPEGVAATAATVAARVELARRAGALRIELAATEAVRRAADREELVSAVRRRCGLSLRILSGDAEARLSFLGATAGGVDGLDRDTEVVVIDLGGASTEICLGRGTDLRTAVSLAIGSDALIERHRFHDPPTPADRAAAAATIREALAATPAGAPRIGLATGGTAANLPALLGRRRPPGREDGAELGPPGDDLPVAVSARDLARARTVTERGPSSELAAATGLHPDRARLLAGGTQLLEELARHYGLGSLTVTERGLRDGLLLEGIRSDPVP